MIGHGKTDIVAMGRRCSPTPNRTQGLREPGRGDLAPHQLLRLRRPALLRPSGEVRSEPVLARESELGAVESTPAETPKKIVASAAARRTRSRCVAPCEGTTSPSSKRRATSAERCVSRRCSTNPTRLLGGTSTRCGAWWSTSAPPRPQPPRRLLRSRPIASSWRPGRPARFAARADAPRLRRRRPPEVAHRCWRLPGRRGSFRCRPVLLGIGRRVGLIDDPILAAHRAVHAGGEGGDHRWSRRPSPSSMNGSEGHRARGGRQTRTRDGPPRRWRVLGDLRDHGVAFVTGARDIEIGAAASPGRPTKVTQGGGRHGRDRSTGRW